MERIGRWSEEDRRVFREANRYLSKVAKDVLDEVERFNLNNPEGLLTFFEPHSHITHWGYLYGGIPTSPGWKALEFDDILAMGDFADFLGEKFDLRTRRIFHRLKEENILEYSLKPNFNRFRRPEELFLF